MVQGAGSNPGWIGGSNLPLGVPLVLSRMIWFLPVLGIEFLPLGLLLIARSIPFLSEVARLLDPFNLPGSAYRLAKA